MRRKNTILRQGTAMFLAAVTMVSSVPVSAADDAVQNNLLAKFDFEQEAENGQFSSSDAVAKVVGTVELQERTDGTGKALYLDGSSSYLDITGSDGKNLLSGLEEMTISYDAKPDRTSTNWGFYISPDDSVQTYKKEHYIGACINNGTTTIERYNNSGSRPANRPSAETGSEWSHVDVVFTKNSTKLYVNGLKKADVESDYQISDILGDASVFYIGRANWGTNGEYYKGWIDNFEVYGSALTDDDLLDADAVNQAVAADKAALTIPNEVDTDFVLPVKGENGSDIAWTSNDEDHIKIDGEKASIYRELGNDVTVSLTATITQGTISDQRDFEVKVVQDMNASDIVTMAVEQLQIPNADEVRENLYLPTEIEVNGAQRKASVNWSSSNTAVVTDKEQDGKAAGMVSRTSKDEAIVLTATVSCGDSSQNKTFNITVKAKKDQETKTSYLFAHFTGTEGRATDEQIYFATSQDGSQWTDMTANGSPALTSDIGDKGVRDPYLLRSHDGDKFYLIATDLSIYYRGGWGKAAATTTGSLSIVIWESTDLIHWSEPRLVDVASDIPGAGCVWAPEAIYDKDTGNYVVYWATRSAEDNEYGDPMNMYYATTRDFYHFSKPVKWIDRENSSIIDTTMIYDDTTGMYYRASGDGQITIERSDSIYNTQDQWERMGDLTTIFNNSKYSGSKLEGPEFFEYCQDDWLVDENNQPVRTWGLMCDQYSEGKGYLPFRTTNLADMTENSWSAATDVNFGALKKRHGTILAITDAEYKAVMQYFGYADDEDHEDKILVDFNFDDETNGFHSENAVASGEHSLYPLKNGKALKLNGAGEYLEIKGKEGESLLTGNNELTISLWAKPEEKNSNWLFYIAPDTTQPKYPNEKYIGAVDGKGKITAERYNNSGSRPKSATTQVTADTWYHLTVVHTENETILYVNGEEAARESSTYSVQGILGNNSIFYIGKALWEGGEYYSGLIDELKVYNYALSAAEAKEVYTSSVRPEEAPAVDEGEEADKQAAEAVIEKINALGEITSLDNKTAVEEARAAYDALTDAQKELVTNKNVLETAEAKIKALEEAGNQNNNNGGNDNNSDAGNNNNDSNNAGNNNNGSNTQPSTDGNTGNTGNIQTPTTPTVPTAPTAESIVADNPALPSGTAEDSKSAVFCELKAMVKTSKATSNKIQWSKVKDADGYVVFGNKCNSKGKKYKYEVLSIIENNNTTSYTHTGLAKATYYKYLVQAYKMVDGKAQIISTSKTIHAATKNVKTVNVKKIKVNKTKVTLQKKGKTFKLKATAIKTSKKKVAEHRKLMYESSNSKIATVNSKGVIKAKKKGTCTIYVYAQNGVYAKVTVKVKK